MSRDKISMWRWCQIRVWLWQHDRRMARMRRRSKPQAPEKAGWYRLLATLAVLFALILFNLYRVASAEEHAPIVVQGCAKIT